MPLPAATSTLFATSADEVEAAFYQALRHGDLAQVMACWADDEEVVCIHPGGRRLIGYASVRDLFEAFFINGGMDIQPERVHKMVFMSTAIHSVLERVTAQGPNGEQRQALVMATNVYHHTAQGWRMVLHHASGANPDDDVHTPFNSTLH